MTFSETAAAYERAPTPATLAALRADILTALGDRASADRHRALGKLALRSILATGDGTQDAPWSVLMISDEYDVLQVLGRRSTGQQLVRLAGRRYDKHTHSDGTASWFDITALPEPRATAVTRG